MSWNFKDLTGKKFGRLTVIEKIYRKSRHGQILWKCLCSCGKEKIIIGNSLSQGHTRSCGCLVSEACKNNGLKNVKNLIGKKFGTLTVIERGEKNKWENVTWKCLCDCGREKILVSHALISNHTKSCGWDCSLKNEIRIKKRFKENHGYIKRYMPSHLNSTKSGYILEHILIMSNYIGRPLLSGETVHHKNGIRDDNLIENLELRLNNHHPAGQSVEKDLIPYWVEMLKRYKPEVLSLTQ